MSGLSKEARQYLQESFGERVNFKHTERKLYGHDIAEIPSLIKPLIGNTVPDAVVQPVTEEEVVGLVNWARENSVPLTPRGAASSGYGGVVPVKNGIVVDFHRMNNVLNVNKKNLEATVQTGIIWERLDKKIAADGVTLRLYPSSYPASTVGGWLAQGGAGYGSYENGWFRENVVSAKLVGPDGQVKVVEGDELDMVSEAEGITGFIIEVTIKLQPLEDLEISGVAIDEPDTLQKLLSRLVDDDVPLWSVIFTNPTSSELKNEAPLMEHWGHPAESRVVLPKQYIVTLAYRKKDSAETQSKLDRILGDLKIERADDEVAHHEWDNRFKTMVVKRLGPSLVPAEVRLPLDELGAMIKEVNDKIEHPVVKEGIVIKNGANGRPEVVILGFIPADQRTFGYNLVFSLSLTIMKIAERHGGGAYSTGMFFAGKAPQVLGKERLARLREYKSKIDPKGIMNPGKVIDSGLVAKAVGFAQGFEPLTRWFGNRVHTKVGERPTKMVRDIPADVAWYAYACSQCGYCVDQCDQYYGRGWESQSPRGKWYWLREYMEGREEWNQAQVDTFLVCTTCEMCNTRCSSSLPIEPSWMKLRGLLIHEEKKMTFPPFEMMKEALLSEGDIWAGYRKDRTKWFPEELKAKHGPGVKAKNVYFAGCTASYCEKDIGDASVKLLDAAGIDFTFLGDAENCCGTPMKVAGLWDAFDHVMIENIENVKKSGADTVISSCPACDMMWRHVYPDRCKELGIEYEITAKHYTEVISEKLKSGEFKLPDRKEPIKVTWHDSCHIGRASGVYEPPRDLIKAIGNVEFVEMPFNKETAHCCGSVLTLIKEPPIAAEIGKTRLEEAVEVGADAVLALCPCCEFQLRVSADRKNVPMKVIDLSRFAAETLGLEFPDPYPWALYQWSVFEAFVYLMTPDGFAKLMAKMWPELIDAMPFGMGSMMRGMGKIPGALNLMKPMFPILFPRLLPMMMPKVMPKMLSLVEEMIDMPDYMVEQMPELMPKVMDSLMPHMVGDLVPLVADPMVAYLQGKS